MNDNNNISSVPTSNNSGSLQADRDTPTLTSTDQKAQNAFDVSREVNNSNHKTHSLNGRELHEINPLKTQEETRVFLLSLKDESQNVPRAFQIEAYNLLSLKEETCRNQAEGFQESLVFFEKIKRHVFEVAKAIYLEQLKIISDLLQQPKSERKFDTVSIDLKTRLADLKRALHKTYAEEITQQKFYVEDGVKLQLTKEKAAELEKECSDNLDHIFQDPVNFVIINSKTDLDALKRDLEDRIKLKDEIYERLNQKNEFEQSLVKLQKVANEILVQRLSYFHLKADDLWTAAELGDQKVLLDCLKKLGSFSKRSKVNQLNSLGFAPIHLACYHNQIDILRELLNNKGDPSLQDGFKYRPLHWAAKRGVTPCAELLLTSGADINGRGQYGRTPLHMSVFNGHIIMTKFLLERKGNINATTNEKDQCKTPLHDAVIHQDLRMVTCLTSYEHLDVNIVDAQSCTPFYHAVFDGNLEIAMLIQAHKSWKDCQDKKSPNHLENLLKMKPKKGADNMIQYLTALKKRLQG